jgi:hypothetical protein
MGVKDSREIVAASESGEDRGKDERAHSSKEIIVRTTVNVLSVNVVGRGG